MRYKIYSCQSTFLRHLMLHHLSKRCGKCVPLRMLNIGILRKCYRTLPMCQLVTIKKVINFLLNLRAIHHRNQYPCREDSSTDHSDLKFSDTFSDLSRITSFKSLYFFNYPPGQNIKRSRNESG